MTTATLRPAPSTAGPGPTLAPSAPGGRRSAPLLALTLGLALAGILLAPSPAEAGSSGTITVTIRIVSNRIDLIPAAGDGELVDATGAAATSTALATAVERCADSLADRGLGHLGEQVREQVRSSALVVTPDGAYSVGAANPAWVIDSTAGARAVVSL